MTTYKLHCHCGTESQNLPTETEAAQCPNCGTMIPIPDCEITLRVSGSTREYSVAPVRVDGGIDVPEDAAALLFLLATALRASEGNSDLN